jgi:ribonucleoside-diphosphate reductase alpha chain
VYATNTAVVAIPQQSPEGAVCREQETAEDLLNRAIRYNKLWVSNGHREGENKNNVSCTISVKEEEWDKLGELMWKNRNYYSGISLLPYDNSTYQQMPFEECSQQKYEEMEKLVKVINFRDVKEMENNTNLIETIACSGGICSVEYK